jgi:hypothetical protein
MDSGLIQNLILWITRKSWSYPSMLHSWKTWFSCRLAAATASRSEELCTGADYVLVDQVYVDSGLKQPWQFDLANPNWKQPPLLAGWVLGKIDAPLGLAIR